MVLSFYPKHEKEYESMSEKEMMQNLLGIRKKPSEKEAAAIELADSVDELAEMFCDSAIVLSRIASLLQGKKNPWDTKNFEDMDEDDMACMDATVLFAVPGKPVQLMTEEDALSKFPGFDDEQTFYCVEIGDHLFLHSMEHTWQSEEDITITAPVYIARVNDDETECEELTAMDFLAAMIFLKNHFVTITGEDGKTVYGYWLPKEKKED